MVYRFLIWLFSTPQEAEAIIGDLEEEGAGTRQYVRAIFDLAIAPFRQTPFRMAGLGILFLTLTFPLAWLTRLGAQEFLLRVPVYQYIPASVFWELIAAKPAFLVGVIIAIAMRRRHAMSALMATLAAMAALLMVIDPALTMVLPGRPGVARGFMFWASRAMYALVFWGGTIVLGTIVGLIFARPRPGDSARRRQVL